MIFLMILLIVSLDISLSFIISNKLVSSFSLQSQPQTSIMYDVYIENTDAFQVMYYANYMVFLERAICTYANNHRSRVANIKTIKFKKPAVLGDKIEIKVKTKNDQISVSIVKYDDTNNDNTELLSAKSISLKYYNDYNTNDISPTLNPLYKTFQFHYKLHHDELGINNIMTTKTVFNLFERARTDILGGPKVLAESSSSSSIDDDIVKYYVGRITDYSYVNDLPKSTIQDLEKGPVDICVLTQCVQVGDSMCDFQQQISSSNLLIAKANVLVVSVNGKTGGSSPYPMKIRKLFDLTNSV